MRFAAEVVATAAGRQLAAKAQFTSIGESRGCFQSLCSHSIRNPASNLAAATRWMKPYEPARNCSAYAVGEGKRWPP
jgi:hypothetical protein